ncbi:universal stress protein [Phytohabitans aurantiacus]|jgi:nucleotide-binding universal stress UspA family protein|uniref:Universal stress protein n=1 Tax=Phytohabitans aurantiacus TaxID=3016789 RepID=A0ABQ5QZ59_9ACTN|nr:universal stress protein [Phytohabitans aurantiacus]GLH99714.1 universal stress protein [Phytohabitans aurantiacus]
MTQMPRHRVVVGLDGLDEASAAVPFAAREAKTRGCPLLLVGAVGGPLPEVAAKVRRTLPGLVLMGLTTRADLGEIILEESRSARLVVVGRPPAPDAGRYEQVAAHAWCPTIVVPVQPAGEPCGRVLLGVAVTPYDEPAIAFAFEEAELRGIPLDAIHVWSGIPQTAIGDVDPFEYHLTEAHATADRLLAETLGGWVEKYPAVSVMRTPLYDVNPAETLLAASQHADLIVLAANQHGAHTPHLLGPVTRAVLARAACPIAVVRHGAR